MKKEYEKEYKNWEIKLLDNFIIYLNNFRIILNI